MKNLRKLSPLKAFLVLASLSVFTACKKDDPIVTPPAKDITDIAIADTQFSTLVAALTKAGLVQTLKGTGPFTVFAPNNAAFTTAKITSLDGLSAADLTPILTAHVVSGKVLAADVKSGTVPTVNAANSIYLSKNADGVFINGKVKVIKTDVTASNGVIHVIDNVIEIPNKSLVTIAAGNTDFSELVSLVLKADPGVAKALTDASVKGYTVFAPTNAAFTELYKTTPKATLLDPKNVGLLTKVLLYHVVEGRVFSTDLPNVTGEVATVAGDKIGFDLSGGAKVKGISSGNSTITAANILATNGVIHVIDKVLLPKL